MKLADPGNEVHGGASQWEEKSCQSRVHCEVSFFCGAERGNNFGSFAKEIQAVIKTHIIISSKFSALKGDSLEGLRMIQKSSLSGFLPGS